MAMRFVRGDEPVASGRAGGACVWIWVMTFSFDGMTFRREVYPVRPSALAGLANWRGPV
jgi:hypothetical protein